MLTMSFFYQFPQRYMFRLLLIIAIVTWTPFRLATIQLRYPKRKGLGLLQALDILVGRDRIELSTNGLRVRCSTG